MKVKICLGARCTMYGADLIHDRIEEMKEDLARYQNRDDVIVDDIDIELVNCFGYCKKDRKHSPVIQVDDKVFTAARSEVVMEYILDKAFEKNFHN